MSLLRKCHLGPENKRPADKSHNGAIVTAPDAKDFSLTNIVCLVLLCWDGIVRKATKSLAADRSLTKKLTQWRKFSMSKPGNAFDAKRRHRQKFFFLRPQLNSFFFSLLHATTVNGLNVALLTNWLLRTVFLIISLSYSSMSFFVVFFLPLSLPFSNT